MNVFHFGIKRKLAEIPSSILTLIAQRYLCDSEKMYAECPILPEELERMPWMRFVNQ
jgi:hypothetical protein